MPAGRNSAPLAYRASLLPARSAARRKLPPSALPFSKAPYVNPKPGSGRGFGLADSASLIQVIPTIARRSHRWANGWENFGLFWIRLADSANPEPPQGCRARTPASSPFRPFPRGPKLGSDRGFGLADSASLIQVIPTIARRSHRWANGWENFGLFWIRLADSANPEPPQGCRARTPASSPFRPFPRGPKLGSDRGFGLADSASLIQVILTIARRSHRWANG